MIELSFSFDATPGTEVVLAPGVATPHAAPIAAEVTGARLRLVAEPTLAQHVMVLLPEAERVEVRLRYATSGPQYPEGMFAPRDSRFTRSAAALAGETRAIAEAAGGGRAGLQSIVSHVAGIFDYGHPETRFYDETDEMPQLCSMEQGSCVDINAYLIAALRAAGYEAGYVYGVFVPEEKRSWAEDGHCWVVTRHEGLCEEWDIAHFLKMGRRDVAPGLNPRPGVRLPLAHSMGWTLPELGLRDVKLMGPPMGFVDGTLTEVAGLEIRLSGYETLRAAAR
ncbi:MAG: hypothetical protein BM562_12730 [Alphaproteobacteria bacterium MedPE-SWcel]|nr:MAG: hypothetical protein BM562_12730 [Alphaproteobacteria bacterium MedPE-SWcel]